MRALLRNIGWLLGSRGINAALSLVYLWLATRSLGLTGFGQFALIVVMAQTVAGVASFSTWQAVVRWGHAGESEDAVGFAVALDLLGIVAGTVLAALVAWTAPLWLPLPEALRPAAFGLGLTAVLTVRSTPTGILRLHDRFALGTLAEAALPATRALGAILSWLVLPTPTGFVVAWAGAEIACAAVHWLLALRLQRPTLKRISLYALPSRHPDAWRFVLATNASRTLAVTAKQVLGLLVGAFGGAALAGGYRVAAQLGQALVQLAEAVSRALYPELVRGWGSAHRLAKRMTGIAVVVGLVAATMAALFGQWALIALAGPDFEFAHGALVLLALAGAAELVAAGWDALLVAQGRPGVVIVARALPLAVAIASMPWAIANFGLAGVASCVLAGSTASAAWLGYGALASRGGAAADATR